MLLVAFRRIFLRIILLDFKRHFVSDYTHIKFTEVTLKPKYHWKVDNTMLMYLKSFQTQLNVLSWLHCTGDVALCIH